MITIIKVNNKSDLKKFIRFPNILHHNNENFIPLIYDNEVNIFSPNKNDAFSYCESQQFLALKDNKIVGRVATILNFRYNVEKKVKQMRFSRLDMIDDVEVTKALMEKVKEEAIKNDCEEIVGPMGFCELDQQGLYEQGYDILGDFYTTYNLDYYNEHLKQLGFQKDHSWNIYRIQVPTESSFKQNEISNCILEKYNLKIVDLNKNVNYNKYFYNAYKLRNKINGHLYGYNELTEKQIKAQIESNKFSISFPYSSVIVNSNDEVMAFCFAAPSINKALNKKSGKLHIIDKLKIVNEKYQNDFINLYSIIIHYKYQNIGLEQVLLNHLINKAIYNNIKFIDTDIDIDYNDNIIRNNRELDTDIIKVLSTYKIKIKE